MDLYAIVPMPDTIPAPWGVFEFLGVLTFTVHIIFMNVVLGGLIIALFSRLKASDPPLTESVHGALVKKVPVAMPLAITFGVAPLLFLQVNYGHLFYSSTIMLALFWILIIPFLIIAYYGAYIQSIKYERSRSLSIIATFLSLVLLLYIAFIFSNTMTMMLQPERWSGYFDNPGGTILNTSDPQLVPRFLHMVIGAVAVAGLFSAVVWSFRKRERQGPAALNVRKGLKVFAYATMIQILDGIWFLLAQPDEITRLFIGENMLNTGILWIGAALGVFAVITAMKGRLGLTVGLACGTLVFMAASRALLRAAHINRFFDPGTLTLSPQYGTMMLFFIVFIIGLVIVGYMLAAARRSKDGSLRI